MSLTSQQILAIGRLGGYGPKSVYAISELSKPYMIQTPQELADFVNTCIAADKRLRHAKAVESQHVESAMEWADRIIDRSDDLGIKVVSFLDKNYPQNLLGTIDENGKESVPAILFYKGDLKITTKAAVAVIGTREPSPKGARASEYLGELYAKSGYNIVSGLAVGCDACGHKGALRAKGFTTAFLAHGLDTVYPSENAELAEEIVDKGGLLMTEYPIGVGVSRYNLVARDRLQAALSDAMVVVQTGIKGGALHASRAALLANKPLFCVKYNSVEPDFKIAGNSMLVNEGARFLSGSDPLTPIQEALSKSKESGKHPASVSKEPSLFDQYEE